ncbi:response regulator transcription factor [Paraburkholderia silviterrae]|uniref:Response regulator n=1 Tax=Paraburkholderia silviterrae TaxID=2528715 RepID=A0A4R5M986_9BURK|nr:response regulator [Paraburkholderia silviterrae]TDG22774.1 response regulator [Paraburkholderia silviterrae]
MQTGKIVCVVDDDEAVRLALSSFLRSFGWQVQTFDSAQAFLASAVAGQAAFLITDMQMPGISGIDLHAALRAQQRCPPTVFVTSHATPELEARIRAAGGLALLQKPCDLAVLASWLSSAIGTP